MPGVIKWRSMVTRLAPLALMPAAAFAVHQLRYWLAYGDRAGAVLQRQGHAYLHSLVPWLVLLLAVGVGVFLRSLGRAFGGQRSAGRFTLSFAALWLACTVCLVAIFATQEALETVFATGHPAGFAGIFGYGGWWAIPASACVALVLAAVLHGARWVLDATAARYAPTSPPRRRRPAALRAPHAVIVPRSAPVAAGWSDRGPPR